MLRWLGLGLLTLLLSPQTWADAQRLGVVNGAADGTVTLYWAQAIHGGVFELQWPDAQGQLHCCQRVSWRQLRFIGPAQQVSVDTDAEAPRPARAYRVLLKAPSLRSGIGWLGLAAAGAATQQEPYLLARDASASRAWLCTGQEGVQLLQRQGLAPLRRWHVALGYDLASAPSCNEQDQPHAGREGSAPGGTR
ncbi:hypothetical protein ACG0Z6_16505 [Roseateles sp. BYS180W]|uniref:Uncharacterized protein n=1 Tax=Roseateles rivi TaxID=3299028 RepID=A0ABW7FZT9_9BURK